jgi:hypothetical protein
MIAYYHKRFTLDNTILMIKLIYVSQHLPGL